MMPEVTLYAADVPRHSSTQPSKSRRVDGATFDDCRHFDSPAAKEVCLLLAIEGRKADASTGHRHNAHGHISSIGRRIKEIRCEGGTCNGSHTCS